MIVEYLGLDKTAPESFTKYVIPVFSLLLLLLFQPLFSM